MPRCYAVLHRASEYRVVPRRPEPVPEERAGGPDRRSLGVALAVVRGAYVLDRTNDATPGAAPRAQINEPTSTK